MSSCFTAWTFYISLSDSSLLPSYGFVGFEHYTSIWANRRWNIAYNNLFLFSGFYVVVSMAVGLMLAICIDQRVRGEAVWRTIFLYPLAVSFVVTGTVWSWLYSPNAGIEFFVRSLGWTDFTFRLTTRPQPCDLRRHRHRHLAVLGLCHGAVAWPGCARSIRTSIKAAQIDGAGDVSHLSQGASCRRLRRSSLRSPSCCCSSRSRPSTSSSALTNGGPGISTTFPAIYVYDLMFQRGQIARRRGRRHHDPAGRSAVVLVPYSLWVVWRRRKEAGHG